MEKTPTQIQQDLLRPMFHSSARYWVAVAFATLPGAGGRMHVPLSGLHGHRHLGPRFAGLLGF